MENKIRNNLNEIYFGKTKDIVNGLRSVVPLADAKQTRDLQVNNHLAAYNLHYSPFVHSTERVAADSSSEECRTELTSALILL